MNTVGESKQGYWFVILISIILGIFLLTIVYPIYYLFSLSLSTYGGLTLRSNPFMLLPAGFTLEAYIRFFTQRYIHTGYGVTVFRTLVGTPLAVFLMSLAAYALSKKGLPGRKYISMFFLFTMFFTGGIIPTYMIVKGYGLTDNIWVFVFLPLFSTYYILILRSYFAELPESLEEAAKIDGASELRVFFNIIMPLSVPALVTIATWVFFTHWNSWFDSLLYIQSLDKHVVQIHIRRLVIEQSNILLAGVYTSGGKANMPTEESMRAAGIMITVVPVLCIYPFVKRFFVKGMTLGAVKG